MDRNARFRCILADRRAVKVASLIDPLSARIAEGLGYEAGALLSSAATIAVLGDPDLSLISLTEMAEQTRRITRACDLPVLVDGEQGFGNALNARRTVEEIEAAGASAVTIEDTVLPRAFGGAGPSLVSLEEGVGKMRAALGARRDPSFTIIARTSAFAVNGADDGAQRLAAYEKAGVDAVYLAGVRSVEDLARARKSVSVPIVVGAIAKPLQAGGCLREAGIAMWVQGNAPAVAALRSMHAAYAGILEGSIDGAIQPGAADPLVDTLTRNDTYRQWTEDFLR